MDDPTLSGVPSYYLIDGVQQSLRVRGRGSYGAVFEGHWRGSKVAIKRHYYVLVRDETGRLSEPYRRFLEEFPILKALPHPNIVQVFGMVPPNTSMPQDTPGLVMEFLHQTLRKRYDDVPLLSRLDEATISLGVVSALDYLHSRKVVHRDLTTNNIMMCDPAGAGGDVKAKVTDIGCAAVLGDGCDAQYMTLNPGAQVYMAPETQRTSRREGHAKYGSPADCYSYAVSIMSMCNRREPPDIFTLLRNGRGGDIASLGEEHPLHDVIVRCLTTDPKLRPTASDLCGELAIIQLQLRTSVHVTHASPLTDVHQELASARRQIAAQRQRLATEQAERAAIRQQCDGLQAQRSMETEMQRLRTRRPGSREELERVWHDVYRLRRERRTGQAESSQRIATTRREAEAKRKRAMELEERLAEQTAPRESLAARVRQQEEGFEAMVPLRNDSGMRARCWKLMPPTQTAHSISAIPQWTRVGESPRPPYGIGVGSCVLDGRLYISSFTTGEYHTVMMGWSAPVDDLKKSSWTEVKLPPGSAIGHIGKSPDQFFFSHRNDLYFVNGQRCNNTPQSIWKRRPQHGVWEKVAQLPDDRIHFGLAVVGTSLIVAGGSQSCVQHTPAKPSVISLSLDEGSPRWFKWKEWPGESKDRHRLFPNIVVCDQKIHIIGGEPGRGSPAPVLTADLSKPFHERVWSADHVPPAPKRRPAAVVFNGFLVVCGGEALVGKSTSSFMLHSGYMEWLPLPNIPSMSTYDGLRPSLQARDSQILIVSAAGMARLTRDQ